MNIALAQAGIGPAKQARFLKDSAMRDAIALLIEADGTLARQIEGLFSQDVFAFQTAGSIFQARKMIDCAVPDIILLDRELPDGDGIELCAELRVQERTRKVPILFMSSLPSVLECVRSLKAGGDDYLSKPFHPEELFARVGALLRRVRRVER